MKWLGDDHIESFKNNWMEVVNLQRTALSNSHLSEILLDLVERSETMKNDVAEFRRRVFTVQDRDGEYKYLMDIMSRHVAARKEKDNNAALCQSISKAGKASAAVVVPKGPSLIHI